MSLYMDVFFEVWFLDGMTGLRFSLFISAYELQIEQNLWSFRLRKSSPPILRSVHFFGTVWISANYHRSPCLHSLSITR